MFWGSSFFASKDFPECTCTAPCRNPCSSAIIQQGQGRNATLSKLFCILALQRQRKVLHMMLRETLGNKERSPKKPQANWHTSWLGRWGDSPEWHLSIGDRSDRHCPWHSRKLRQKSPNPYSYQVFDDLGLSLAGMPLYGFLCCFHESGKLLNQDLGEGSCVSQQGI